MTCLCSNKGEIEIWRLTIRKLALKGDGSSEQAPAALTQGKNGYKF